MIRCVSYQPQYFPRLHYFARMLNTDIFIFADNIQFVRKHAYEKDGTHHIGPSYQTHTPIKTERGAELLDYPTKHEGKQSINDTKLSYPNPKVRTKNLRIIEQQYRHAPQFASVFPSLQSFFAREYSTVGEINKASVYWALRHLFETPNVAEHEIHAPLPQHGFRLKRIVLSSESGVPISDKASGRDANDWLVELCQKYDAKEYYFGGTGAGTYMNFDKFSNAGIALKCQEWRPEPYSQLWGDFMGNLSIIDLLMNVPPEKARLVLSSNE